VDKAFVKSGQYTPFQTLGTSTFISEEETWLDQGNDGETNNAEEGTSLERQGTLLPLVQ